MVKTGKKVPVLNSTALYSCLGSKIISPVFSKRNEAEITNIAIADTGIGLFECALGRKTGGALVRVSLFLLLLLLEQLHRSRIISGFLATPSLSQSDATHLPEKDNDCVVAVALAYEFLFKVRAISLFLAKQTYPFKYLVCNNRPIIKDTFLARFHSTNRRLWNRNVLVLSPCSCHWCFKTNTTLDYQDSSCATHPQLHPSNFQ
jgi:hypothetical protein